MECKNYEYTDWGETCLFGESRWLDDTDEWLYHDKFVRQYREDHHLSQDEQLCWNRDKQDWSGLDKNAYGSTMYNTRTIYSYDDQDHLISEEAFQQQDNGEMLRGAVNFYEWTEPTPGISRKRKINALCDETGEGFQPHQADEIYDENAQGSMVCFSTSATDDSWKTSNLTQEQTLTYEDDGIHLRDTDLYNLSDWLNQERK